MDARICALVSGRGLARCLRLDWTGATCTAGCGGYTAAAGGDGC